MPKRRSELLKQETARIHKNTMEFNKKQSEKKQMERLHYMTRAIFIRETMLQHGGKKDRWECPKCRANPDQPECRFNLIKKKRGSHHPCRFCGEKLLLIK